MVSRDEIETESIFVCVLFFCRPDPGCSLLLDVVCFVVLILSFAKSDCLLLRMCRVLFGILSFVKL